MNILYLSYDLPYPLDAGGKIRSYHLIKQLAKSHDVHLCYFYRTHETKQLEENLSDITASIHGFYRRSKRSVENLKYLLQFPFPAALYKDSYVDRYLHHDILTHSYDVLHLESFYMSPYIKTEYPLIQILGTENIEWRVYQEYAKYKNMILQNAMRYEVNRIRSYEKKTWNLVDNIFAVSEDNKQEIERSTKTKVHLIKNGVDTDYIKAKKAQRHKATKLLFVGNFAYMQNRQAAEMLLYQIAPALPSSFHIRLVGKNPPSSFIAMAEDMPTVSIDTEVDDIRIAYKQADMLIAPITAGSGTKFKVLEAMAAGLPVITTPLGAEGILEAKEVLQIGNTPKDLIPLILALSNDQVKRTTIAKRSRKIIETEYSWDAIGKTLRSTYNEIINSHR